MHAQQSSECSFLFFFYYCFSLLAFKLLVCSAVCEFCNRADSICLVVCALLLGCCRLWLCVVWRPFFLLLSLCVDGALVCAEGCTQVTGVMTMMMTGRVLLVCVLCVLWCIAGGGYAEDDAGVVPGGGPGTGKGKKNSEGLSSPVPGLQERQEEPAGGRGSADPQGLKDNVMPTTDRLAPNGEQEANLDVDPLTPNTEQSKNKDSTEAGAGTINQTAPPPARPPPPPPPPPPPAPEAEEVERKNTPEKQDSPVDHHSAQHRAVPQEKELEQQEEDTQGQIINEQHESEQIPVQQEKEKEKQRSEEQLEQREHLHEKEREGENIQEEIRDQQKKQEQQEEEHEQPQEEHDESIKQGKEQEQQKQQQQHETAAKNSDGPTKNETAVGTNAIASTGDSDSSTAVSHTTSPLLLLIVVVACAAAAAVVAA
ncbi:Mucin-associated surface protein (MASP) [Trypanosoma cruzi]|uniref:Mucin-associated surface protein (MASP) n=1 Tax=Trypanosoma cruzi TaxID=5693 RepID=A0A2V2V1U7_TRYCR|nr:Mucin-associated surface protein (MASP) [Trypanosoma cruzi]